MKHDSVRDSGGRGPPVLLQIQVGLYSRRSDPADQKNWSTGYVLHKTYSVTVLQHHIPYKTFQVIPGNDQNTTPTNQKTAGSNLERTSQLMFYGSRRHPKSFSGNFLMLIFLLGCFLTYLLKSLVFNRTMFE